ncbi:X-box-binding protein 1 [Podarcis raffonei]|uniref:X-box-binding protein 1 n=1 Tax=Podarcis raffonei TaxID=65483 RepID=UPI00232965BF|nr:X-box-binding protein 1 [Podarcis raffonei]
MRKGLWASQSAGARGSREEPPRREEEERAAAAAATMVPLPVPASGPPPPHARLLLLPAAASSSAAAPPAPGAALSPPPRKRQRLAHLSPEEKALRRKLKNRVAAQSARDRKKARMGELERQAVELEAENQKLLAENLALRERTHSLARENRELRLRLGLPALEAAAAPPAGAEGGAAPTAVALKVEMLEEDGGEKPERGSTTGATAGSAESAALRLRVPLQQGQAQQPLALVVVASAWIQTTLILQILSLTSSWAFWTAWIQTCSCTMEEVQNQPVWRSCTKKRVEKQIPYQPPPVPLWGPQHPSWRPLMN